MKNKFKGILILFVGIITTLLGLLWFLQGSNIIQVCPILCFSDCECLTGESLLWEIIGTIVFFIGITSSYFGFYYFMKKKLLIFDMDGVLFDSIGFAERVFLEKHPGVTKEMYREIHSGNYYEEAKKYDYLKTAITEEEANKDRIIYAKEKSKSLMFVGIKELINELYNLGYTLILNTSAYERNCLPLLEKAKIKEIFDFVATAETSRSKIEKFKFIEEKYKIKKEDILFITDALGDLREADKAGISTITVTWGVHDKTYFTREVHNNLIGVVNTVKELRNLILKNK